MEKVKGPGIRSLRSGVGIFPKNNKIMKCPWIEIP
jgi:hypothetical protein